MRRNYLDLMRGIAVVIMVEAHALDSWTREADRSTTAYGYALIVGGFGAPIFLFLAGVAVAMSAGSKFRKGASLWDASVAVQRRGWQIFGLAFLFRLQAYLLSPGSHLSGLLKVDILNIMGPAIAASAALWACFTSTRARALGFSIAAAAVAMLTPPVRNAAWLAVVPDPIEAYIRPVASLANFTMFPWAAFVLAGAVVGTVIDASRSDAQQMRVNAGLALGGLVLCAAGYAMSLRAPLYTNSNFWTSSPTFFAMRVGLISAAIAVAYAIERWWGSESMSALQLLGRESLFVYWIHIEMVYGLLASPIRRQLALPVMFAAYVVFTFMLYVIVRIKNDLVDQWKNAGAGGAARHVENRSVIPT